MATIVRRRLMSPLVGVEVERIDPAGPAVGQVHGGAVGAPADAVGDGQAGQHGRAAAVQFQPVERAGTGRLVIGHRAGPEATLRRRRRRRSSAHRCAPLPAGPARGPLRHRRHAGSPGPAASTYPPPAAGATAPTCRSSGDGLAPTPDAPSRPGRPRCRVRPRMSTQSSSPRSACHRGPSVSSSRDGRATGSGPSCSPELPRRSWLLELHDEGLVAENQRVEYENLHHRATVRRQLHTSITPNG